MVKMRKNVLKPFFTCSKHFMYNSWDLRYAKVTVIFGNSDADQKLGLSNVLLFKLTVKRYESKY